MSRDADTLEQSEVLVLGQSFHFEPDAPLQTASDCLPCTCSSVHCETRAKTCKIDRRCTTKAHAVPPHRANSPGSIVLKQKSAIVTGSTSGIGLGIARAVAEQGAGVMLNGFGNAQEIEFTRAELQRQFGVNVRYS